MASLHQDPLGCSATCTRRQLGSIKNLPGSNLPHHASQDDEAKQGQWQRIRVYIRARTDVYDCLKKKREGVNKKAHVKLEGCTAPTPSVPITTTTRRLYRVTLDGLLPLLGLNRVLDNGFLILGSDFRVHATGSELI